MEHADLLKKAVAVVERANVPEDLREIAFAKVLEMMARTDIGDGTSANASVAEETSDQSELLVRIASKIGIKPNLADRIFDHHEDALIFSGNVTALGSTKAGIVQNLALLMIAGRRWAGLDLGGSTADEIVRAEVDRHSLLDVTNYNKHIGALKPYVTITGSGKSASYKIKYDGLEKAKQLAHSLAGE
jgi:hypothetical protein